MRFSPLILYPYVVFVICGSSGLYAQKSKGAVKADSTVSIIRKEKIQHPLPGGKNEKPVLPLAFYDFNFSLNAVFTFTDSSGHTTSRTDYTYYFDKGSDFFALKEVYQYKGKVRSSFWIEELNDSIGFKANIGDSIKTLVPKHLNNFQTGNINHISEKAKQMILYKSTGNTKTINGYLCESFVLDNEQYNNTLWVTVKEDPLFSKIRKDLQGSVYIELTSYIRGIVMVSESYFKQSHHTQKFEVTAINKNVPIRIITDGAKLIGGF